MLSEEQDNLNLYLTGIVSNLPESPGCYQYLDKTDTIIYVGKAKNLKRRVSSYFNREHDNLKTNVLVRHIRDIKYIVVNTEEDALLLENNLIKQWKPKYNILLKDGKTYPSIVVTNEYLPRIYATRIVDRKHGTYFGPYSHIQTLHALLELIKNLYPLRQCKELITADTIKRQKHKECLEFHIKNCKAPCVGRQSRDEYIKYINEAKEILKGNTSAIEKMMLDEMQRLSESMRFEEAELVKKRYMLLENYRTKSEVVSSQINNVDVFNIEDSERVCYINYLHVSNGTITQAFTFEYVKRVEESTEDMLLSGIVEMRSRYGSTSREIIVPFHVEHSIHDTVFTVPQKGEKAKLLNLSKLNVLQYKKDRIAQADKLNPEQKQVRLMKELQEALGIDRLPMHIECFDNSNIDGTDAVAGCVVFRKAKPARNDYRRYNIKTVEGPDDYATMREVVRRRYSRMLNENTPLPDLIITDGGKGQMEVVRQVVEDELGLSIYIAGLAKDDRHRTNELLFGFPPKVVGLRTESQLFHLLTRIQDEVHRYAISFHRDKRSKRHISSELELIRGIGPKSKDLLLKHFKSIKRMREAPESELISVVGQNKASILMQYFKIFQE